MPTPLGDVDAEYLFLRNNFYPTKHKPAKVQSERTLGWYKIHRAVPGYIPSFGQGRSGNSLPQQRRG